MKINTNSALSLPVTSYLRNAAVNRGDSSPADPNAAGGRAGDSVVLSERARETLTARRIFDAVPDVRSEKVMELKAQIASGRYPIDARKIASNMLGESLALGMI